MRAAQSSMKSAAQAARAASGEPKAKLAREYGISRETLYQYLKQCGLTVKPDLSLA
jgi:DNA-binding XRE family transcriptional regulator